MQRIASDPKLAVRSAGSLYVHDEKGVTCIIISSQGAKVAPPVTIRFEINTIVWRQAWGSVPILIQCAPRKIDDDERRRML
jgi:hypothetical protein